MHIDPNLLVLMPGKMSNKWVDRRTDGNRVPLDGNSGPVSWAELHSSGEKLTTQRVSIDHNMPDFKE